MMDGMKMVAGDSYFVPKIRLVSSGIPSIMIGVPANASGSIMYWDFM